MMSLQMHVGFLLNKVMLSPASPDTHLRYPVQAGGQAGGGVRRVCANVSSLVCACAGGLPETPAAWSSAAPLVNEAIACWFSAL